MEKMEYKETFQFNDTILDADFYLLGNVKDLLSGRDIEIKITSTNNKTMMVFIQEENTLYINRNVEDNCLNVLQWAEVKLKENNYYI